MVKIDSLVIHQQPKSVVNIWDNAAGSIINVDNAEPPARSRSRSPPTRKLMETFLRIQEAMQDVLDKLVDPRAGAGGAGPSGGAGAAGAGAAAGTGEAEAGAGGVAPFAALEIDWENHAGTD